MSKRFTRREMLKMAGGAAAGSLLAACSQQGLQVIQTVEVVKEVQVEVTAEPPVAPALLSGTIEGHVVVMHLPHEFTEDHIALLEEEHPGVTAEVVQEDQTRFFAMYAAGTPPDLLRLQAPNIPQYLARNLLYDLTPFFEVSTMLNLDDLAPANDYYKAYSALDIGDGPIYGMTKDYSPDHTIFVYKPLFEEAGLDVPDDTKALSYQEIAELSEALTTFDGDRTLTFGYGYDAAWVDRFWMNMLAELDKGLFSEDFTKIVLLEDEANLEVARYYYDLAANKLSQSSINPSPAGWFGTDFTQGILAMAQYGFWFGAMAESDVTAGEVIMLPGPTWSGARRNPTITATGMIMTAATEAPEAAWTVFEFYNAGPPAVERAASGWGVPALKSLYDQMPNNTEYEQQKLRVLLDELTLDSSPLQFNPFLGATTVADSWNTQLDRTLNGEITFEDALANVEAEVNAAIQDGVDRII
jgi:multiple sugar transport system substrate-binding protein